MLRKLLVFMTALAALALIAAPTFAAKGGSGSGDTGNKLSAKACQKDGWKNFTRSDGTTFASEKDCTSYAAKGGVLTEPSTADPLETACNAAGGALSFGQTTFDGGFEKTYFSCTNPSGMSLEQKDSLYSQAVATACAGYAEPGYRTPSVANIYDRTVSFFFLVGVACGADIDDGT